MAFPVSPTFVFSSEMAQNHLKQPHIIDLGRHLDHRGNLSVVEQRKDIPFDIARIYWIYDVPGGGYREGHAYHENQEFIIALSGNFDVIVDDVHSRRVFSLNRSYYGLYVPSKCWRQLTNFSTNSVALILASTPYDENDYILDYSELKSCVAR